MAVRQRIVILCFLITLIVQGGARYPERAARFPKRFDRDIERYL